MENITLGDAQPDHARAREVARTAGFHQAFEALPQGYDTPVSAAGRLDISLRQGLAITRALYPDPAVLILDDATGCLDVETESELMDNLAEALKRRTVITCTQRPGLVQTADHILVLDHGTIVEQGTHKDLLARGGLYHHLQQRQAD